MVDPDALRLIALRLFDQGNASAWRTLETAADEIEALRKGVEAVAHTAAFTGEASIAEMLRALLKGTPNEQR